MELLTELKIFLFLGCICYMLTILSFLRRHAPTKIMITRAKKPDQVEHKEESVEKEKDE